MSFSIEEILVFVGIAVVLAVLIGGYMVISRKKRWM
jgi:hypothetical protein